jgi:hypothetical protein
MKLLVSFLTVLMLSGCASLDTKFLENRVVCTVAKDEAHVVSKWGPVGIASKIAEADAKVVCK